MGRKAIDLTGQVFGRLTVISREENDKRNKARWLCRCACGKETVVNASKLRGGEVTSCGCMQGIKNGQYRPLIERHTHNNRLYNIWDGMHYRCEKPSASNYKHYGGRGINVCQEWSGAEGFDRFSKWAVSHGYTDNMEIDRINNDLGYEPSNCRWVIHQENSFHRRARGKAVYPGVSFRKDRPGDTGAWRACISINGKSKHIGTFKTKEEAIEARKRAEIELGLRKE